MSNNQKKILVCPLDWGLGHATRCIPLINYLLQAGYTVDIAGYGQSLVLLQKEFPAITHHYLNGFTVRYSSKGMTWMHILLQLPKFVYFKLWENIALKKLVKATGASIIVSDNRYGLYHKGVPSYIITHQINPILPLPVRWMRAPIHFILKRWIMKFDQCLIPDFDDHRNLSGDLNKKAQSIKNVAFIGYLSRFGKVDKRAEDFFPPIGPPKTLESTKNQPLRRPPITIPDTPFILAIVSGPDPQRSLFTQLIKEQCADLSTLTIIIEGRPDQVMSMKQNGNTIVLPHLDTQTLKRLIEKSEMVVCRAGYTSIMDMSCLKKEAILIPTPGQTEQEYLANRLYKNGLCYAVGQSSLTMQTHLANAKTFYELKQKQ
jgi:UDP:flavonoid glycosyltransferase YjiC (YdhE family)